MLDDANPEALPLHEGCLETRPEYAWLEAQINQRHPQPRWARQLGKVGFSCTLRTLPTPYRTLTPTRTLTRTEPDVNPNPIPNHTNQVDSQGLRFMRKPEEGAD